MSPQHYVGLISGTSMDGIDAIVADLSDPTSPKILNFLTHPYPPELRARLGDAAGGIALGAGELARLDGDLGLAFATAAQSVMGEHAAAAIRAIGSHGQNLYHGPHDLPGVTLQLANPHVIAQATGIAVVADFRRRDVALGGEGAPLAPTLHEQLFRSDSEDRAVLNLGGIANLTLLPADSGQPVTGFDTGPGNCLMDDWVGRLRHQPFDQDGQWAASGRVSQPLLQTLLADPWFSRPPPKSTGREYFNMAWLEQHSDEPELDAAGLQATLCELTAVSVAEAVRASAIAPAQLLVCGGGSHNRYLMGRIAALLAPTQVLASDAMGVPADAMEALLFAELARRALHDLPSNLTAVTGAPAHRYGVVYPA